MSLDPGGQFNTRNEINVVDGPEGLATIYRKSCAATIWERTPSPRFQDWIDGIPAETLPRIRTTLQPGAVRRAMYEICQISKMEDTKERQMLVDDVSAMAHIFADLTEAPFLRLQMTVMDADTHSQLLSCAGSFRLVCTYRGADLEYSTTVKGNGVQAIRTVKTGSPVLLRGGHWSSTSRAGLKSQFAPASETGDIRLVLCLDPVIAQETEAEKRTIH